MKKTYVVSVIVDVWGDTEADFKEAARDLKRLVVPHVNSTCASVNGTTYTVKNRRIAAGVRLIGRK